jgi:hypothetical protein
MRRAPVTEENLVLPTAQGWAVKPVDDSHTAVVFAAGQEKIGVVLGNDDLSRYASRIIQEAVKESQRRSPSFEEGEAISANPIPVQGMSLVPGRVETEAMLTLLVGNLTLTFALDVSMMHDICTDLLAKTGLVRPPGSH